VELSQSQKDELQDLVNEAIARGLYTEGAWAPVYARLFDFLTEYMTVGETVIATPVAGVLPLRIIARAVNPRRGPASQD